MPKPQATEIKESRTKHLVGRAGKLEIHQRAERIELRTPSNVVVTAMTPDETRRLSRLLLAAANRAKYDTANLIG